MKTRRSEQAAKTFFSELQTGERWDFTDSPIKSLVWSAFFLYEQEWACHRHDVRSWEWPLQNLKDGKPFNGHQPWSVLFREAVDLASRVTTS